MDTTVYICVTELIDFFLMFLLDMSKENARLKYVLKKCGEVLIGNKLPGMGITVCLRLVYWRLNSINHNNVDMHRFNVFILNLEN